MPVAATKNTFPAGGFGHIIGYAAGYSGYLWSKVYAQDMFTRFRAKGLLDTKTGLRYRKWILEPGGSKEPIELIKGFLGRTPNAKAFYKTLGIN
jgi:thimet oligopeptidase